MGNASCFGGRRMRGKPAMVVHPVDHGGREGGVRRLKVRMTNGQLKELMAELKKKEDDSGRGLSDDSELGRLVFRECLKGRLHARLVSQTSPTSDDYSHLSTAFSGGNISLSTIQERSDDDDDEDHHDHS